MSNLTLHGIGMAGGKLTVSRGGSAVATRIGKRYTGAFNGIDRTLQVNLEGITDYTVSKPFINQAKCMRGPTLGFSGQVDDPAYIDANGYVTGIDPAWSGQQLRYYFAWDDFPPERADKVVGSYVFTYDGTDLFTVGNYPGLTVTSNTAGRIEFTLTEPAAVDFRLNSVTSGGYPRNFKIIRTDQQALFDAGEIFDPDFLADLSSASCLRFMDWMETNATEQTTWEDYPTFDQVNWRTVPFEVMVALCNKLGVDGWWQIPTKAAWAGGDGVVDTSFAVSAAQYLKANLHPDLVAKVEYSNEAWNSAFLVHNMLRTQALAAGWADTLDIREDYCAKINALMAKAMVEVYGDEADARFRWVFGGCISKLSWAEGLLFASGWATEEPEQWFDPKTYGKWIAPAPYFGVPFVGSSILTTESFTMDVGTDGTDYGKFGAGESITPSAVNLLDIAVLRTNGADGLFLSMQDGGGVPFNTGAWLNGNPDVAFTLRFPGLTGTPSVEFRRVALDTAAGYVGTSTGIRALVAAETSVTFELVNYEKSTELVDLISYVRTGATQAQINTYMKGRVDALGYIGTTLSRVQEHKDLADANGCRVDFYEGGTHILHSFSTGLPDAMINEVVDPLSNFQLYAQENVDLYAELWDGIKAIGANGPFQQFSAHGKRNKNGIFTMREYLDDTNPLQTYLEDRSASEAPWLSLIHI